MTFSTCINELSLASNELTLSFQDLSITELNTKRQSNQWSIGQNIEHLILFNRTYIDILTEVLSSNYTIPWYARFNIYTIFCGKQVFKTIERNSNFKTDTSPIWKPTISDISGEILKDYSDSINMLIHKLQSIQLMKIENLCVKWPADNSVFLSIEKAMEIIIEHQWRHIQQSKEILYFVKTNGNTEIQKYL